MAGKVNYLTWNITKKCNFRCKYCYFPYDSSPAGQDVQYETIVDFLDNTGKDWVLGITGGEPFILPNFVELCRRLTKKHKLEIDTNLSFSKRIREFAETIDPSMVLDIYAALHIEERERINGVRDFIDNVLLLKEKGFFVSVNYVIHPTLTGRFARDQEYFASQGVRLIPRPFKGIYNGVEYPAGYGLEAKALFKSKSSAGAKMVYNFKGVPCEAGKDLIRLEPDGTVLRCSGDKTVLGNINGAASLYEEPQSCRVSRCPCFGLDYVILNESQSRFMAALGSFVTGKLDDAENDFLKSAALADNPSNSYNNLGVIHFRRGDLNSALNYFKKALTLNPLNKIYALNTAELYSVMGQKETACRICLSYLDGGRDGELNELLEKIREESPLNADARLCVDFISADTKSDIFSHKKRKAQAARTNSE